VVDEVEIHDISTVVRQATIDLSKEGTEELNEGCDDFVKDILNWALGPRLFVVDVIMLRSV
jgi:hypothetical protein